MSIPHPQPFRRRLRLGAYLAAGPVIPANLNANANANAMVTKALNSLVRAWVSDPAHAGPRRARPRHSPKGIRPPGIRQRRQADSTARWSSLTVADRSERRRTRSNSGNDSARATYAGSTVCS
jgi:hypothetical protein